MDNINQMLTPWEPSSPPSAIAKNTGQGVQTITVRVTPAAARAVRSGHPWVFDQALTHQNRSGASGDLAAIYDANRRFLAIGLYDPASPIRIRVLQRAHTVKIDAAFFKKRVEAAASKRRHLEGEQTTAYRLVHGENDHLPGLIVDRYDDTLVMKVYTAAWLSWLDPLLIALEQVQPAKRVVLRVSRSVNPSDLGSPHLKDALVLKGPPIDGPIAFLENGLSFEADVVHGHKTGFFLDQRENRQRVERLAAGTRVLNVFSYTGAFSVYAARGGALSVTSVDQSQPALKIAAKHFERNAHFPFVAAAEHHVIAGDAFHVLDNLRNQQQQFDLVVIDPPAMAHKQAQVDKALHAYRRLVQLGLGVLRGQGTLVLASCSSRVSAPTFFETVHTTANRMRRPLREIERTEHAADHPVGFEYGAYLKALFSIG